MDKRKIAHRDPERTSGQAVGAWLAHLITASGVVFAMLALAEILEENWTLALGWLVVALAVDGIDGTIARRARVSARLPRIDGAALDLVVDYLNYVFIPAIFIWRSGLVPPTIAFWLVAAILLSALYNFCRRDMKTEDQYFRGFPALWNVVALYLYVAAPQPGVAAALILFLAAMTFAPIMVVHPFRVRDFGAWLPGLAIFWAVTSAALLWPGWLGQTRNLWLASSAISALILFLLGLVRTFRGARLASPPERDVSA